MGLGTRRGTELYAGGVSGGVQSYVPGVIRSYMPRGYQELCRAGVEQEAVGAGVMAQHSIDRGG